jgi:hypothetical protein
VLHILLDTALLRRRPQLPSSHCAPPLRVGHLELFPIPPPCSLRYKSWAPPSFSFFPTTGAPLLPFFLPGSTVKQPPSIASPRLFSPSSVLTSQPTFLCREPHRPTDHRSTPALLPPEAPLLPSGVAVAPSPPWCCCLAASPPTALARPVSRPSSAHGGPCRAGRKLAHAAGLGQGMVGHKLLGGWPAGRMRPVGDLVFQSLFFYLFNSQKIGWTSKICRNLHKLHKVQNQFLWKPCEQIYLESLTLLSFSRYILV